jgi:2-iminobutanoate/2-iminopropanoate deaminase
MNEKLVRYPTYVCGIAQVEPNINKHTPLYANAVVVDHLVFISGQTAIDPETGYCVSNTIQDQVQIIMEKIHKTLLECGSDLQYLVKDFIILKYIKDYPILRTVQQAYYKQHAPSLLKSPPGSTVLQAAELARPYYLVEIEAIGWIPHE